jgi:ABC-type transport system involved in multi-copper enzyme maturation permease subunit
MRVLTTLAVHLFREQVRSRTYLLVLLFGAAMVYASVLIGVLAVDDELRVLLDLGLGMIELTVLAAVIYGASTSILQEMESKTIYLILTRPLTKWQYLLGRFLGLVLSAAFATAGMGLVLASLLLLKGWTWQWGYPVWLFYGFLKVILAGALATLFALISTSVVSAVVMTAFLWMLGHFLPEVAFMVRHGGSASASLLKPTLYIIPNLQLFNLRDRMDLAHSLTAGAYLAPVGYLAAYSAVVLALAICLFDRKEF